MQMHTLIVDTRTVDAASEFHALLRSAAKGNSKAITYIYRAHQPALLRWLRTFSPDLAEDVASDAWFNALRSLKRFDGTESDFRSWLFTIARRRLIDLQRRQSRQVHKEALANDHDSTDSSNNTDTADQAIAMIASDRAIKHIISSLPHDQAEIILLRVIGGLDANQTARIVGKKPGTVRVLQHRALQALAASLQKPL